MRAAFLRALILGALVIVVFAAPAFAQTPAPAQPDPDEVVEDVGDDAPVPPSITVLISTAFIRPVLADLCASHYTINLTEGGGAFFQLRELLHFEPVPEANEFEAAAEGFFKLKWGPVAYTDDVAAAMRIVLRIEKTEASDASGDTSGDVPARDTSAKQFFLAGYARFISVETRFGKTLDAKVLLPRANKALEAANPLFRIEMTDLFGTAFQWPDLGDGERLTVTHLKDFNLTVLPEGIGLTIALTSTTTPVIAPVSVPLGSVPPGGAAPAAESPSIFGPPAP